MSTFNISANQRRQIIEDGIKYSPQLTGEKVVTGVFQNLTKEIEKKIDKIVQTCRELEAHQLDEQFREKERLASSNSLTNFKSFNTRNNFDQDDNSSLAEDTGPPASSSNSYFNLPATLIVVHSDTDECLKILKDRSESFNQSLQALQNLSEFCLPSLVSLLFAWTSKQEETDDMIKGKSADYAQFYHGQSSSARTLFGGTTRTKPVNEDPRKDQQRINTHRRNTQVVRRLQAINYYFGLILIEIMKNLKVHPLGETLVRKIINTCFSFFQPDEDLMTATDILIADIKMKEGKTSRRRRPANLLTLHIADIYSECLGVVGVKHFYALKQRYVSNFSDLENSYNANTSALQTEKIVRLIRGIRWIKISRFPIQELQEGIQFVLDIANKFVEYQKKNKEIRQQYATTLVDILIPLSVEINLKTHIEVNVPIVTQLVDFLYPIVFDMVGKTGNKITKNSSTPFKLTTAILSLSKKEFFIHSWGNFIDNCLRQLKNNHSKEQKENRIFSKHVLDCIVRLVYVYCLRYGENYDNKTLHSDPKLDRIFKSLFPSQFPYPVPREAPVAYFVKLMYYISIKKLDQVMKLIIDLLGQSTNRKRLEKSERINIGLRAYLYISDSLRQKKEIQNLTPMNSPPSGSVRVKETYLTYPITADEIKKLKLTHHYSSIQTAFDTLMSSLDTLIGRKHIKNTDMLGNSKPDFQKSHLILYETCIGALPVMSSHLCSKDDLEISSILCRAFAQDESHSIFNSVKLQDTAKDAFKNFIINRKTMREDMLVTVCNFFIDHIDSSNHNLLNQGCRLVEFLLNTWVKEAEKDPSLEPKKSNLQRNHHTNNNPGQNMDLNNSETFPEIKDGVEPNPDLHGPKSTASFALKRIQAFVLALFPCWLTYIDREISAFSNLDSKSNKYLNHLDILNSTNFLFILYRILELCKNLQNLLNLNPFNDKLVLDVLDGRFQFLVSTGQISKALDKTVANYFRHHQMETLFHFLEYHVKEVRNLGQKRRANDSIGWVFSSLFS